jgi:hypothetical protein
MRGTWSLVLGLAVVAGCSTGSAALKKFLQDNHKVSVKVILPRVAEVWIGNSNQDDGWAALGTNIAGSITQVQLQEKVNRALELPALKQHLESRFKAGLQGMGLKVVDEDHCDATLVVKFTKLGITSYAADMPANYEMWGSAVMNNCDTERNIWTRVLHEEGPVTAQAFGGGDDFSQGLAATINFMQLQKVKPKALAAGMSGVADEAADDVLERIGKEGGLLGKKKKKKARPETDD